MFPRFRRSPAKRMARKESRREKEARRRRTSEIREFRRHPTRVCANGGRSNGGNRNLRDLNRATFTTMAEVAFFCFDAPKCPRFGAGTEKLRGRATDLHHCLARIRSQLATQSSDSKAYGASFPKRFCVLLQQSQGADAV